VGDRRGHLAIKPGARAVAVHRCEQDFTGATRLGFPRPFDGITCRVRRSASDIDRESVSAALRIDRDDHGLAAVSACKRGDERGVAQCRGVEADLVGPGVDRRRGIIFLANAAANRQRQKNSMCDRADGPGERLPAFKRCRDIQNDDLVDAFDVVPLRQLRGIAGMAQLLKLDALDDLTITNIHARDDAFGQHSASTWGAAADRWRATSRKLRMICNPASLDFSGWNCTPKTLPRSTTAANVSPCVVAATQASVTGAA